MVLFADATTPSCIEGRKRKLEDFEKILLWADKNRELRRARPAPVAVAPWLVAPCIQL